MRIWDLETGCAIRILRGHTCWVTSVCVIPGTDYIISSSSDLNVILWDVKSSPNLLSVPHVHSDNKTCPVLSLCQYDEQLLISCTKDQIYVWDPQQHYENVSTREFSDVMRGEISCMCENKTNKSVIICYNYKSRGRSTVIEWFVNDPDNSGMKYREYRSIINCICSCTNYTIIGFTQKNAILIKEFVCDKVRERTINLDMIPLTIDCVCVDSSKKSSIYIIILSQSKDILVWKCDHRHITQSFALRGHTYPVRCLTHLTVTKKNINYNYILSGSDDYTVKLWLLPEKDIYDTLVEIPVEASFEGHTLSVLSVFCSSNLIISGSSDSTIMIWSFDDRKLLRTLTGHTSEVTGLQISVANHLVSVSKDGTLKVWDLSVGQNVPSDVELHELIRVRHNEHGYGSQVTDIIESMSTDNFQTERGPLLVDIIKNHSSPSDDKSKASNDADISSQSNTRENIVKSAYFNMVGILKSFHLRVMKSTLDLVLYSAEGDACEMLPLVHWMSRQPLYRDFLLDKILSPHPEVLYARTNDGETLFRHAVQNLKDPDFTYHCLKILSSNLQQKSLEMMWRDHYEIHKNDTKAIEATVRIERDGIFSPYDTSDELWSQVHSFEHSDKAEDNNNSSYPLVDVEDIVEALETLGQVDNIRHGILSLQRAPDKLCDTLHEKLLEVSKLSDKPDNNDKNILADLRGKKLLFWDSDSVDKILVRGCHHLFRVEDVDKACNRHWVVRKFMYEIYSFFRKYISSTEDRSEIMRVMYVPFPMRLCQRGKYSNKQHTSSLILESCIEIAIKKGDATIFQSSVLSAILTYKLKKFGWATYCIQFFLCTTLAVHFGYYSIVHSKMDVPIWWPILLFIHFIPVVILELLPFHLSTVASLNATRLKKFVYCVTFFLSVLGVVGAVLWISYDQPGSEYDIILDLILFLSMFMGVVRNLKYDSQNGFFARMLFQVLERMWSFVLFLTIYFVGFAAAFNILIPTVRRAYDQECSDTPDTDECNNMKATTERFQYPVISGVTTYMTMMNTMGWDSTAFNISTAYSIYALIALICISVFLSNIALNITIALMNNFYDVILKNEHASSHLAEAQYVLGIERLLLYFGLIRYNNPKHFPRWILVVCPQTHQSVDDKKDQADDETHHSVSDDKNVTGA